MEDRRDETHPVANMIASALSSLPSSNTSESAVNEVGVPCLNLMAPEINNADAPTSVMTICYVRIKGMLDKTRFT